VIGGHLVPPPRAVARERAGIDIRLVDIEAARAGERGVAPLADLRSRPGDEFVDIAVIVGEKDIALEMLGRGAGIVAQAREAEIGAQRVEQRERLRRRGVEAEQAVGQLVADIGELGGGKVAREFERSDAAHVRPVAGVEDIGEGDLLPGARHLQRHLIVADEQGQLFAQISLEQIGARYRRDELARPLEMTEGEVVAALAFAKLAIGDEAQRRIVKQAGRGGVGGRQGAVTDEGGDGGFEIADRRSETRLKFGDDPFDKGGGVDDIFVR